MNKLFDPPYKPRKKIFPIRNKEIIEEIIAEKEKINSRYPLLADVNNLVEFCEWILNNISLCDERCQMDNMPTEEKQECSRAMCPSTHFQILIDAVKANFS